MLRCAPCHRYHTESLCRTSPWENHEPVISRDSPSVAISEHGNPISGRSLIAVAHRIATGKCLRPDQFSGGTESIRFLGSRGFRVVECTCGGALHSRPVPTAPDSSGTSRRPVAPTRHSERCRECKIRVRELLERIYGTCLPNHRSRWPTDLTAYSGTSIHPALRNVASALEAFRGFAVSDFARSAMLAPCDFWIPQLGFVVEFDESQHFTYPRKLGLSAYPHEQPLGFSAKRWIGLCEHHTVMTRRSRRRLVPPNAGSGGRGRSGNSCQATAPRPFFATSVRSFSEGPRGRFLPRSHWLTRPVVTFR